MKRWSLCFLFMILLFSSSCTEGEQAPAGAPSPSDETDISKGEHSTTTNRTYQSLAISGSLALSHDLVDAKVSDNVLTDKAIELLDETGDVRIYSGAKLVDDSEPDALLQMLYNPDSNPSNFGKAVSFADISGDGIPDFVVTADSYSTQHYQNAGAIYIYELEPIAD